MTTATSSPLSGVKITIAGADEWEAMRGKERAEEVDLRQVSFKGTSLGNCYKGFKFQKCDLSGMDLTGLDMTRCQFNYCDLRGAKLDGTDLTDSRISSCVLDGASLVRANLHNSNLEKSSFIGADFTSADLSNIDFRKAASYVRAVFADSCNHETLFNGNDSQKFRDDARACEEYIESRRISETHRIAWSLRTLETVWSRTKTMFAAWMNDVPFPGREQFKAVAAKYLAEKTAWFEREISEFKRLAEKVETEAREGTERKTGERKKLFRHGQAPPPFVEFARISEERPLFHMSVIAQGLQQLKCKKGHGYHLAEQAKDIRSIPSVRCSRCRSHYQPQGGDFLICDGAGESCATQEVGTKYLCPVCAWSRINLYERKPLFCPKHKDAGEMELIKKDTLSERCPGVKNDRCKLCGRDPALDMRISHDSAMLCVPCKQAYCGDCLLLLKSEVYDTFAAAHGHPSG